jgi:phosphopentomutase
MGLGNAAALVGEEIPGCPPVDRPTSAWGAMNEASPGKDTTTGHWEMAGLILEKAFPVFPPEEPSFPPELVDDFVRETGIPGILGNRAASGTAIIEELGAAHLENRKPICYTSADSVFQIACHKSIYPIEDLYRLCEVARELCDAYNVGRVIARPFDGEVGKFTRTAERHDWSIELPGPSVLDDLQSAGVKTVGVGKIGSIFNEQGIDVSHHDAGNEACLERTQRLAEEGSDRDQIVFVNLVDTDMVYGHRRDPAGYHDAVARIDAAIPKIRNSLNAGDVLVVTADHGCDPTFRGTDHTREYVPLLFERAGGTGGGVGIRDTFADLAATFRDAWGVASRPQGTSFWESTLTG